MNNNIMPWDCHPDLTEERLQRLAQFFANTRRELMTHYDRTKGDDSWSLGCRGFSWCKNRLMATANSNAWPWLSIVNPTKRFIFGIGVVPVRFYRGRIDNPPMGTLTNSYDELRQLSLAFPGEPHLRDLKWRFAIETGLLGEPTNIIFAGLTQSGEVVCHLNIPYEAEILDLSLVTPKTSDAVELPEPTVFLPQIKRVEEQSGS
jgi:hypothetical protein